MQQISRFWNESVPANLILLYRAIPDPVRERWSFGKPGTSALAYRAVRQGLGWSAYRRPGGISALNLYLAVLATMGVRSRADSGWWTGGPFRMLPGMDKEWFWINGIGEP
jgi:hypothetical protein